MASDPLVPKVPIRSPHNSPTALLAKDLQPVYVAFEYRKVGELNRVVLPEIIRKAARINIGDDIMIATDGNAIYIVPNKKRCNICGSTSNLREFKGFALVCDTCSFKIVESFVESEEIKG